MKGKIYYQDYFKEHGITLKSLADPDLRDGKELNISNVLFIDLPYLDGLYDIYFTECIFKNVRIHGKLDYVSFNNCEFEDVRIIKSELSGVQFVKCVGNLEIDRCIISGCYINNCEATFKMRNCLGNSNIIYGSPNIKCPLTCPSEGSFIAYKKCYRENHAGHDEYVVKLLIPEDAKRSSSIGIKCRASKAVVLDIIPLSDKKKKVDTVYSASCLSSGKKFPYRIGETVYPDDFDENRFEECASGIHFFMNFEDAVEYCF